jgi:hypothetical protein
VISKRPLVALGTVYYQSFDPRETEITHSTTDELPKVTFIPTKVLPGTGRVTIQASEPKFQSFIDEEYTLVIS